MDVYRYLYISIKRLINKSITKYTISKKRATGIDEFVEKEMISISLCIYIDVSLFVYIVSNCLTFRELNKRFPE